MAHRWPGGLGRIGVAGALLLCAAGPLGAAEPGADGHALDVAAWSVLPFAALLLAIALLPIVAHHFWHSNRNRALVSGLCAFPVLLYLVYLEVATGQAGVHALFESLREYLAFILLLASLYVTAGGIAVDVRARPGALPNVLILAFGGVVANLIGTTGASMVLIRPFLRLNAQRQRRGHLPIFFIFVVSNLGGLLTPLGDPPLFIGFLRGVDFFWTLTLWREWLLANALVLAVFFAWDLAAWRRESGKSDAEAGTASQPRGRNFDAWGLRLEGWTNVLLLAGVIAAVLLKSPLKDTPYDLVPEACMALLIVASLALTPRPLRRANGFTWGPIVEVAIIFIGIFITMIPALALLQHHAGDIGLVAPRQYFWLTGLLSACLDNAPTYLTFATLALGPHPDFGWLVVNEPDVLAGISCGAVFFGACTYIGNGPNFMVKAITEETGYPMPSFFGYILYAGLILLPIFAIITVIFF